MMYYIVSNELYHHGIKGQHWGERRYQNPDGSYTEEGRKRYFGDKYGAEYGSKEAKKKYNADVRAYARDRKEQMRLRNRLKNGESRLDVEKKLREKYGDIEYDSFEKSRKKATARGKMILAAAALTAASTAALVAKKIGDEKTNRQKEAKAGGDYMDLVNRKHIDESNIELAGNKHGLRQPKRDDLNESLNMINSFVNNHKNTDFYKTNKGFGYEKTLNNMYNRAWDNTQQRRSEHNIASAWKSMKPGTQTRLSNNPHMTSEQRYYGPEVTGVTRSMPMRSRGQAMQYAPKSNSFTRSSNGLRRKYKPTW